MESRCRHDNSSQTENPEIKHPPWAAIATRIALSGFSHPFEYVKVLIQIGHEPLPPYPTRTLFGRPALALPGAFQYIRHIKAVDGFCGLYRGLGPKLVGSIVSGFVYSDVMKRMPSLGATKKCNNVKKSQEDDDPEEDEDDENEEEMSDEERFLRFMQDTIKETAARCAAVFVSHPFHVITIRTMAQFVGREEHYRGLFPSVIHIYREEGIRGYFVGLVPRMLAEVFTLWFAQVATFVINNYIIEEKVLRSYIGTSLLYVASAITYPFALVCNVSAVNNCGLTAGMPPNMPIYYGWTDAWRHLSSIGQLKRGSSILWRYYCGPLMLDPQGRPAYPRKSSFRNPSYKN